jgi:hypothetical protein
MAAAASELEQLAWGADDFEKQQDGLWAALLSARGQELLAGTGLVSTAAHSSSTQHAAPPAEVQQLWVYIKHLHHVILLLGII